MDPETADALENAHGTGPQGNVAGSLVDVLANAGPAFAQGGLVGVGQQAGMDMPGWVKTGADIAQNPDLNAAIGMGRGPSLLGPWSNPETVETFERMLKEGHSYSEIAEVLGLSRDTVRGRAFNMGLNSKNKPGWNEQHENVDYSKAHAKSAPSTPQLNLPPIEEGGEDKWLMQQLGYK